MAYHAPQVEAGARLGFPVVRCQFAAPAEVLTRLLPLAEKHGIKIGPEIHAALAPNSPPVLAYREAYARANSPLLGSSPTSARAVAPSYVEQLRSQARKACPKSLSGLPSKSRRCRTTPAGSAASSRAAPFGAAPEVLSAMSVMFDILSPGLPEMWDELMPQVIHVHGKI